MAAILLAAVFCLPAPRCCAEDFVLEGIFEAALDIPRVYFLLKRQPNGPPIEYEGYFELNYGFLDTGASGILLSRETVDLLGISIHPGAVYADVGVGGSEFFDVSEPLYFGMADYNALDPYDTGIYSTIGPWRSQVKQHQVEWPEEPLDVIGMPAMAGKVAIFRAGATNELDYFSAAVVELGDPAIPIADFEIGVRFESFSCLDAPENVSPYPVVAHNPVIDNVRIVRGDASSVGTYVFDTGGMISIISTRQGALLGLVGQEGQPLVTPDFTISVGGIGAMVEIPGFQVDSLSVPTLCGFNLVYDDARICVHDISYLDCGTGELVTIDGIFGSNFLCASAKMEGGWPVDLSETPYDYVVLDTVNGVLGFDVNDLYPVPQCELQVLNPADFNRDGGVDMLDIVILAEEWLKPCDPLNAMCGGTDLDANGRVDFRDFAEFAY